jgi:FkbM family methyltransferase
VSVGRAALARIYRALPTAAAKRGFSNVVSATFTTAGVRMVRGAAGSAPLFVSAGDPWGLRHFYLQHAYDLESVERVAQRVAAEQLIFWDIGANYGAYTVHVSKAAVRTIAVEPASRTFACLSRTCAALDPPVDLRQCALGDALGEAMFYARPGHSGDGRTYLPPEARGWVRETVPQLTVDHLASAAAVDTAQGHFLKIDVQGTEPRVLSGARGLLTSARRVYVLMEVWPLGLREAGFTLDDLIEMCRGLQLGPIDWAHRAVGWSGVRAALNGPAPQPWVDLLLANA